MSRPSGSRSASLDKLLSLRIPLTTEDYSLEIWYENGNERICTGNVMYQGRITGAFRQLLPRALDHWDFCNLNYTNSPPVRVLREAALVFQNDIVGMDKRVHYNVLTSNELAETALPPDPAAEAINI